MNVCEPLSFPIPLPLSIHATAQLFCQPQWLPQKLRQVYLNTLAVYAVNSYLSYLGADTCLDQGDSWDPLMRELTDAADLVLIHQNQKYRIECRPVLPNASTCYVPPEVWTQRIGYVAVRLDDALRYATLLGFLPQVDAMNIPLSQWRSLDMLVQSVFSSEVNRSNSEFVEQVKTRSHLTEWLKGTVEQGWQQLQELTLPENLLGLNQPVLQFRSTITPLCSDPASDQSSAQAAMRSTVRGKYLDWQFPTGQQENLVLVVGVIPAQKQEMNIWVKICPQEASAYLPSQLEVIVLDERDIAVMQAQSRQSEMIQLKFGGRIGEKFSIKVSLNESSKVESFII
ncbi:MAG: DUF1822 family protein [Cyanobacteria bacterium P01_F01_bin.150]